MRSRSDSDFATPQRHGARVVALEIDGRVVAVPEGTSVIRAAAEAGIHVPKLCATDSLEPFGSCRLCLVEVEGQRGYPASCTTPVRAGMKIRTESPALARLRRGVMELYISDHPLDCLTCPANGNCELQDMAGAVGLREVATVTETARTICTRRKISRIRISPSIRRNASCARDASARVKKCRARSR